MEWGGVIYKKFQQIKFEKGKRWRERERKVEGREREREMQTIVFGRSTVLSTIFEMIYFRRDRSF